MDGDSEPRTKERNVNQVIFCSTIRSLKTVQATHQFLSLALLQDSTRHHGVDDDIESFLWVLLWVAIRHAPNSLPPEERSSLLANFDVPSAQWHVKRSLVAGGRKVIVGKYGFKLTSRALADVLATLVQELEGAVWDEDAEAKAHWSTHDWMLGVLGEALRDEKWKMVEDHSVHYPVAQYSTDKPHVQNKLHEREVDEEWRTKKRGREDYEESEDDEGDEDDKGKFNEECKDRNEDGRKLKRIKISDD